MIVFTAFFVCALVSVNGVVKREIASGNASAQTAVNSDLPSQEKSTKEKDVRHETSTYKYPTATWSAPNYEKMKKKYDPELSKLYLFKPSPFLKPPFTEGEVGASITGIEDGVNVSGLRRGKVKSKHVDKTRKPVSLPVNFDFIPVNHQPMATSPPDAAVKQETPKVSRFLDRFLEESLMKYIKSSNLTDEFGTISVEAFSEALRKITEGKRNYHYDENKELRRKFRDGVLSPKKAETSTSGGLLEKQYQRRLHKTWEVINENISVPSRSAFLDRRIDWPMTELPTTESVMKEAKEGFLRDENRWRPADKRILERTTEFADTDDWYTTEPIEITTEAPTTFAPTPTTFHPVTIRKPTKLRLKTSRGNKKWRDTVPKVKDENSWEDGELKLSVAETVYFRPRQLEQFTYQKEPAFGAIPGEPDKDYPMLSSVPSTGFKCPNLHGEAARMMADRRARCQVFYICTGDGPPAPMLCPNGTLFNENVLVCDWWYNVDC